MTSNRSTSIKQSPASSSCVLMRNGWFLTTMLVPIIPFISPTVPHLLGNHHNYYNLHIYLWTSTHMHMHMHIHITHIHIHIHTRTCTQTLNNQKNDTKCDRNCMAGEWRGEGRRETTSTEGCRGKRMDSKVEGVVSCEVSNSYGVRIIERTNEWMIELKLLLLHSAIFSFLPIIISYHIISPPLPLYH